MADEPRTGRSIRAALLHALAFGSIALACVRPAGAQSGFLQGRYERLVGEALLLRSDSSVTDTTFTQSYWTQNYQLDHRLVLGSKLDLSWQLGFQDRQAVQRLERVQVPYGHVRLAVPTAGLYLSVKPAITTSSASLAALAAGASDTAQGNRVRYRTTQSVLTAYVTPARLPRLDVSWIRDQRGQGFGPTGVADRRNARLSQQAGPVSLRASYGDLGQGPEASSVRVYQRNYGAGGSYAVTPRPQMNLNVDYDFTGFDRGNPGDLQTQSRAHRGALNGSWRQTPTWSWSTYASYQRSDSPRLRRSFDSAEGQLYSVYQPRRAFRLQNGAQVRKVGQEDRSGVEGVFVSAATFEGPIREHWRGLAELSETVTSNSFRAPYGVTGLRGYSQSRLRSGVDLNLSLQASVNRDTVAESRAVSQGNAGLTLLPLRTVQWILQGSFYRVGRSFSDLANDSRTGQVDLRWTPLQTLEFFGSLRRNDSSIGNQAGSTARTAFVRWSLGAVLQLDLNYTGTRPDRLSASVGAIAPREREAVTAHATWNLDRARQLTGQVSVLDPDTAREVTAYDATFTWRFWR